MVAAVDQFVDLFTQLGGLMAERVTDLRDIRDRVIAELSGLPEPGVPLPAVPSILLADDLAPADTAGLDPKLVVALATTLGGPTSHTAIIARQLGIPCVVAVEGSTRSVPTRRCSSTAPAATSSSTRTRPRPSGLSKKDKQTREAAATWSGPGATADGVTVAIYANVADGESARAAAKGPSEGVGLFRSELAFLGRDTEPSVDEQAEIYGAVLWRLRGARWSSGHSTRARTNR